MVSRALSVFAAPALLGLTLTGATGLARAHPEEEVFIQVHRGGVHVRIEHAPSVHVIRVGPGVVLTRTVRGHVQVIRIVERPFHAHGRSFHPSVHRAFYREPRGVRHRPVFFGRPHAHRSRSQSYLPCD